MEQTTLPGERNEDEPGGRRRPATIEAGHHNDLLECVRSGL